MVLISLYVDDKRSLPDSERTTKTLAGQTYNIKTICSKWSYFQASLFNINSQPYYVLLDTDDSPNIKMYNKFLEEGINKFSDNRK